VSRDLLLGVDVGRPTLVPGCLVRLVNKVVSVEAGVGDERDLLDLEANHLKHLLEFLLDLSETAFVPAAGIHLVDADDELIHTEEEEKTRVLAGLALLDALLGISLSNSGLEATLLSGHEEESDISSGGAGDHVLDVILVAGGVDDRVVVLVREELLGVALDGDTTLALLLTRVEVIREAEGRLSLLRRGGVELLHLTGGDTALLEDEMPASGGLAGIDVTADNN